MPKRASRSHIHTLRGVGRMAVDATTGVTDLVHALHTRIAREPAALGGPIVGGAVNGIANLVYGSVKGVTRAVGSGLDALQRLDHLRGLLHFEDVLLGRLEAHRELRLVLG